VVAVRGPDAEEYLQGQLSQDVVALAVGATADSLLLEPDGKLCALLRVTRTDGQGFVLDVDAGYGDAVVARLRRFLLRAKVELETLDWRCLSLRGAGVDELAGGLLTVLAERGVLALPFEWNGWRGVDLLGPPDVVLGSDSDVLPDGIVACHADAVEACRIVSGVPAMGAELTAKTIPQEAGIVPQTVSFTKGCYTGQELVARLDARGSRVARRLCAVVPMAGALDPAALVGAELVGPDGTGRGEVTSAAWCPAVGGPAGLAYAPRSLAVPGPVVLRTGSGGSEAGEVAAELRPLPL
jgi:folate-binding protein YgfZ